MCQPIHSTAKVDYASVVSVIVDRDLKVVVPSSSTHLIPSNCTLIIAPSSTIKYYIQYLHLNANHLSYYLYKQDSVKKNIADIASDFNIIFLPNFLASDIDSNTNDIDDKIDQLKRSRSINSNHDSSRRIKYQVDSSSKLFNSTAFFDDIIPSSNNQTHPLYQVKFHRLILIDCVIPSASKINSENRWLEKKKLYDILHILQTKCKLMYSDPTRFSKRMQVNEEYEILIKQLCGSDYFDNALKITDVLVKLSEQDLKLYNDTKASLVSKGSIKLKNLVLASNHDSLLLHVKKQLLESQKLAREKLNEKSVQWFKEMKESMDEAIINRLVYEDGDFSSESNLIPECSICLEDLLPGSINYICGHSNCDECIDSLIKANSNCPTCRGELKKDNLLPIIVFLEEFNPDLFKEINIVKDDQIEVVDTNTLTVSSKTKRLVEFVQEITSKNKNAKVIGIFN